MVWEQHRSNLEITRITLFYTTMSKVKLGHMWDFPCSLLGRERWRREVGLGSGAGRSHVYMTRGPGRLQLAQEPGT